MLDKPRKGSTVKKQESAEQKKLFEWATLMRGKLPALSLMYHIPNGGSRHIAEAVALRRQGVKAGVPDICLPVACGQYHGLYIELKRPGGGTLSEAQREWITNLNGKGYKAVVCQGFSEAKDTIEKYLSGGD